MPIHSSSSCHGSIVRYRDLDKDSEDSELELEMLETDWAIVFLKFDVDHELVFVFGPLMERATKKPVREGGREVCEEGRMEVPQRAQQIVEPELCPDETRPNVASRRVLGDVGSMDSWPLWMAPTTLRRVSQFSEGARSRRTVGSLSDAGRQP